MRVAGFVASIVIVFGYLYAAGAVPSMIFAMRPPGTSRMIVTGVSAVTVFFIGCAVTHMDEAFHIANGGEHGRDLIAWPHVLNMVTQAVTVLVFLVALRLYLRFVHIKITTRPDERRQTPR